MEGDFLQVFVKNKGFAWSYNPNSPSGLAVDYRVPEASSHCRPNKWSDLQENFAACAGALQSPIDFSFTQASVC